MPAHRRNLESVNYAYLIKENLESRFIYFSFENLILNIYPHTLVYPENYFMTGIIYWLGSPKSALVLYKVEPPTYSGKSSFLSARGQSSVTTPPLTWFDCGSAHSLPLKDLLLTITRSSWHLCLRYFPLCGWLNEGETCGTSASAKYCSAIRSVYWYRKADMLVDERAFHEWWWRRDSGGVCLFDVQPV